MIEHGLVDSSHYKPKSSVSDDPSLAESVSGAEDFVSLSATDVAHADGSLERAEATRPAAESPDNNHLKPPSRTSPESSESDWETLDPSVLEETSPKEAAAAGVGSEPPDTFDSEPGMPITVQPLGVGGQGGVVQGLLSGLEEDQYGLPLPIFTKVPRTAFHGGTVTTASVL